MWCAADLIKRQGARQEWAWLFDTGKEFFRRFYQPFFDKRDGLYFGQATFVDIHFTDYKATGYPIEWEIPDCVLIKSLSTNCLYVMGLDAMAVAAAKLGFHAEAQEWETAREQLKGAIRQHLRRPDGTLAYFRERHGTLQKRRDALGSALAVLTGIVDGEDGRKALSDYPITDAGVPLLHPFFPVDNWYHNNSSWPFVDTFFIKALEMSDGQERGALNTALLARTCIDDGTFHEVTDYRTKRVKGSASQLWTAAAFIDTCLRSGLVRGFSLK